MASLTFTQEQMKQLIASIENTKGKRLATNLDKVQRKLESDSVTADDIMKILKAKTKKSTGLKQPPNSWRVYLEKTGQRMNDPNAKETWGNMSDEDKKPYVDEAAKLREDYKKQKQELSENSEEKSDIEPEEKSDIEPEEKSDIEPEEKSDEVDEADEPKANSYYKQIDGKKYDRKLLEKADSFNEDDKEINMKQAKLIWQDAEDGNKVTDCEKETVQYILDNYKCNRGAKKYLKDKLA